jgi:hypothetical protein
MAHFGPTQRSPFRNSLTPSRRHRRQTGPVYRAIVVRSSSSGDSLGLECLSKEQSAPDITPMPGVVHHCSSLSAPWPAARAYVARSWNIAVTVSPPATPAAASAGANKQSLHPKGAIARFLARRATRGYPGKRWATHVPRATDFAIVQAGLEPPGRRRASRTRTPGRLTRIFRAIMQRRIRASRQRNHPASDERLTRLGIRRDAASVADSHCAGSA